MKTKLVTGLIAALLGSSAFAATSLSFSSTGTDAYIAITGQGSFESVLKVTPTVTNQLVLSFSSLDGAYSAVSYSFYSDAGLTTSVGAISGYTIRQTASGNSSNFSVGDQLIPFQDAAKSSFNLSAATPYYLKLAGTLNDADAVGNFKVTVGSATVTPVPEPESYAMLLAGLGLMGTIARRRSRKAG